MWSTDFLLGVFANVSGERVIAKQVQWWQGLQGTYSTVKDPTLKPFCGAEKGPLCVFVCMFFNITIVLCFALSPCLRNCRTEKVLATSSPSGPWARSRGPERLSPPPGCRAMFSATTLSRPLHHLTWKWVRSTTVERGPSALLPPCTQQRKVQRPAADRC